jgi:hypothetical protein
MKRIRQFLSLNRADRALFLKALALLWVIRTGLWILGYTRMKPLVERWKKSAASKDAAGDSHADADSGSLCAARVGWAVKAAGRGTPGDRLCLVQALAAEVLLGRRGIPADIRIGVVKDEALKLQAHAWVESGGTVIIGGAKLDRYEPLTSTPKRAGAPGEEPR